MEQKTILAMHDLAGLGRSSLVPVIGVLCAMGCQCVPVPTAVYSSHLALPGWHGCDLTAEMQPAIAQYAALGITFDAVFSGFLSSPEQAGVVLDAAERFGQGLVIVDPVLGDNGKLYRSASPQLCQMMKALCRRADVITPNVTEAAVLLEKEPGAVPQNMAEAREWAAQLGQTYHASIAITGLALQPDAIAIACCEKGDVSLVSHRRVQAYYPGTGDLFAAVLAGRLVEGAPLARAAECAADFVRACIEATEQQGTDRLLGVQFETQLYRLSQRRHAEETPE